MKQINTIIIVAYFFLKRSARLIWYLLLFWRNKIRFAEEDIAGDDKKVHFGGVQNVAKINEQPKKEIKSRHSILKT